MLTTAATLLALATAAAGCAIDPAGGPADPATETGGEGGGDQGGGDQGGGDPGTPPPAPPVASGVYRVTTILDLTAEAVLPAPAATFVETLRAFSTAPARTLFDLAEDAGVPAVGTLRDALPSSLESRVEGWIDAEIAKVTLGGVPVTQVAAEIAALGETTLTQVALASELTVTGGTATHRLVALDLAPAGLDQRIVLGALPGDVITATPTCAATTAALTVGDHGYALAYGAYAWQAVEAAFVATYGGGIRATLGAAVSCPTIAARVAATCLWGVCVGHATELTSICERGLDEVVARARAKFDAYRFDALHLAAGAATLVDADADRSVEALTDGVWTAEINAGQGLRHAPATFTATR